MFPLLLGNLLWSAALFLLVGGQDECSKKMKDARLTPHYFKDGTPGGVELVYAGNKSVTCGCQMLMPTTFFPPVVKYDVQGRCENASIIAIDPDNYNPCGIRIYLHWLVVNIPADVMKSGYKEGKTAGFPVSPYNFPGSPMQHRYPFCVYCQDHFIEEKHEMDGLLTTKMGHNPKMVAQKFGLGDPLACTFYYLAPSILPEDNIAVQLLRYISNRNKFNICPESMQ